MRFRFVGLYTNGHTAIDAGGVTFEGHEPSEVTDPELIRRLTGNQEFEAVEAEAAIEAAPAPAPKKRGRPKKVNAA